MQPAYPPIAPYAHPPPVTLAAPRGTSLGQGGADRRLSSGGVGCFLRSDKGRAASGIAPPTWPGEAVRPPPPPSHLTRPDKLVRGPISTPSETRASAARVERLTRLTASPNYSHCSLFAPGLPAASFAQRASQVRAGGHIDNSAAALADYVDKHLAYRLPDGTSGTLTSSHQPREGLRGQNFQYGGDDHPRVHDETLKQRYDRYHNPPLSAISRNGTNQAHSDIRIGTGRGALNLLSVLIHVVESGYLAPATPRHATEVQRTGRRCHLSQRGTPGFMSYDLAASCATARLVASAMDESASPPEWLRQPTVWSADTGAAPPLESHRARAMATSRLLIVLHCDFFSLLRWFDVSDQAFLESGRKRERLVSFKGTPLATALERQDARGAPSFAVLNVTGDMKKGVESYNRGDPLSWSAGNHKSVLASRDTVESHLSREVQTRTALVVDPLMRHLIPTAHIAPLGLAPKGDVPGRYRLITDTKHKFGNQPETGADGIRPAASLNEASPKWFLTTPVYGSVIIGLVVLIYRVRIAHPTRPTYALRVDTASAFKHAKLHPSVIPCVAVWVCYMLFFFTSLCFGQSFSPSEYVLVENTVMEVFASFTASVIRGIPEAWAFAKQYERDVPIEEPLPVLAQAWADELNQPLFVTEDSPPLGKVFVDDALLIAIKLFADSLQCTLVALLWSKLCFFSPVSFPHRPPWLNGEKLEQWSRRGILLGYHFDCDALTISAPSSKLDEMLELLSGWVGGTTRLTANEMESLVGVLRYLSVFMPCGSFMLVRITGFLNEILRGCSIQRDGKLRFTSSDSQDRCRTYSPPRGVVSDLEHVMSYMADETSRRTHLTCPFELLLWRIPRFHLASDASRWGGGGFCSELRFAWRWEWPPLVKAWFDSEENINVLEFAAMVINFIILAAKCRASAIYIPCVFFTDNASSRSWCAIARMPSLQGAALGRLLCYWMTTSRLNSRAAPVKGTENPLADGLSRAPPAEFTRDFPLVNPSSYFDPSWLTQIDAPLITIPTLLKSTICSAILYGTSPKPPEMAGIKTRIESNFSPIGW